MRAQANARGVALAKVTAGSPAARAGLQAGRHDVIVAVDGRRIHTAAELANAVAAHKPGDRITLRVLHGTAARDIAVTLGDLPASA